MGWFLTKDSPSNPGYWFLNFVLTVCLGLSKVLPIAANPYLIDIL